jgi:hypothetical protein
MGKYFCNYGLWEGFIDIKSQNIMADLTVNYKTLIANNNKDSNIK